MNDRKRSPIDIGTYKLDTDDEESEVSFKPETIDYAAYAKKCKSILSQLEVLAGMEKEKDPVLQRLYNACQALARFLYELLITPNDKVLQPRAEKVVADFHAALNTFVQQQKRPGNGEVNEVDKEIVFDKKMYVDDQLYDENKALFDSLNALLAMWQALVDQGAREDKASEGKKDPFSYTALEFTEIKTEKDRPDHTRYVEL
jgi:hypothetical protein